MSCIVSNHVLYINKKEIKIKHTAPFNKTTNCILIMNCNIKTEFIDILLANICCEMNKAVITINTEDNILDFIQILGYKSIKIFKWYKNKLIYLDSRMI